MSSQMDKGFYQLSDLFHSLRIAEGGIVNFQGEGSAVDDLFQIKFGKELHNGERAVKMSGNGGEKAGTEGRVGLSPVCCRAPC